MFRLNDIIIFEQNEYLITGLLGRGGMSNVFLIECKDTKHKFALKSLDYFFQDDSNYRSLMNEWKLAQNINHPHVINYRGLHDGLTDPSTPYLIMDLANDGSLKDYLLSRQSLLSEDECLNIFHQIIDGIEAVNSILIHRDIKPDNIFINDGKFKIADFGLAKVVQDKTRSKTFKGWGTEPYIAPEAYRAETNTIQMDMYSIGHVFYQIAALQHAFGMQNDWEQAHFTAVAKPLSGINANISPKVSAVINKLIAKKPSNRYASWDEVRQDLLRSTQNTGKNKDAINDILHKKISRDQKDERELLDKQTKENEAQRKRSILIYQFENEVVAPIEAFIDEFNAVSNQNNLMHIHAKPPLFRRISFDNKSIELWFKLIDKSDAIEQRGQGVWGGVNSTLFPTFRNQPVLGWGALVSGDGRGINIVLIASSEDEYGDWYILENKVSGMNARDRNKATPFAFSPTELPKEIHIVGAMHIYETTVSKLSAEELIKFISAVQ